MLVTLWTAGYVTLDPRPEPLGKETRPKPETGHGNSTPHKAPFKANGLLESAGLSQLVANSSAQLSPPTDAIDDDEAPRDGVPDRFDEASRGYDLTNYRPETAQPSERLELLVRLRSINPLYGVYLAGHLAIADQTERILTLESVLDMPATIARHVRVPPLEVMPPGPLALSRLDHQLLELGLAVPAELNGKTGDEDDDDESSGRRGGGFRPPPPRVISIGEKLRRLFNYDFPRVHDVSTQPVWVAGELLEFGGNFNKYVVARGLQKQEGLLFRHVLRLILLLDEMASIPPLETEPEQWEDPLDELIDRLSASCRAVDPDSTDEALEHNRGGDELVKQLPKLRRD